MKKIRRKLNLYLPFARAGAKGFLVYKAQIFMWLFISLVEVLFVVFLYQAIYRNSENGLNSIINGFTFPEMILYMITSFIFSFVVFSSDTSWNIFVDIKEGTIANTLTKPVSYRARHLFTCFGNVGVGTVFILIPLLTIVYFIFIGFGLVDILLLDFLVNAVFFMFFTIVAILINDGLSYFVGLLTFFTEHMFGLNMFRNAIQGFLSGAMLPLSYMGVFGVIFAYTPFAFLNSTPVLSLMGKVDLATTLIYLAVAVFWVLLIEISNALLFKYCIKKVSVQGG